VIADYERKAAALAWVQTGRPDRLIRLSVGRLHIAFERFPLPLEGVDLAVMLLPLEMTPKIACS
jgi:hypothetical protein